MELSGRPNGPPLHLLTNLVAGSRWPSRLTRRLFSAANHTPGAPFVEDFLNALVRLRHRLFRALFTQSYLGGHVSDDAFGEDLADGGVGDAREAEVHRPVVDGLQDLEFVGRLRTPGIFFQPAIQLGNRAGVAGEVVEFAMVGRFAVILSVVQDELLGGCQFIALDVFGNDIDLPDMRPKPKRRRDRQARW